MSTVRHVPPRKSRRIAREGGSALLVTLLLLSVAGAIVASLVPLAALERLLSAAMRDAAHCRYAAEAIAAHGIAELQGRDDWAAVLAGSAPSQFRQAQRNFDLPRGAVDLDVLGATFGEAEPGAWGADTPVWSLLAWGPAPNLAPATIGSPVHVAVWVADDERDGDGDPLRDVNGRVRLRAEAFGPAGGRGSVVAFVSREAPAPAPLRLLDWRIP